MLRSEEKPINSVGIRGGLPRKFLSNRWSKLKVLSPREKRNGENKSGNTGLISADRSTRATLSTYNTWMQLSRLQRIYHLRCLKLRLTTGPEAAVAVRTKLAEAISFHVTMQAVDNPA